MSYDTWKTRNRDDETLGPEPFIAEIDGRREQARGIERAVLDAAVQLARFKPTSAWGVPNCEDARGCAKDLDYLARNILKPLLSAFAADHFKLGVDSRPIASQVEAMTLVVCARLEQAAERLELHEHYSASGD